MKIFNHTRLSGKWPMKSACLTGKSTSLRLFGMFFVKPWLTEEISCSTVHVSKLWSSLRRVFACCVVYCRGISSIYNKAQVMERKYKGVIFFNVVWAGWIMCSILYHFTMISLCQHKLQFTNNRVLPHPLFLGPNETDDPECGAPPLKLRLPVQESWLGHNDKMRSCNIPEVLHVADEGDGLQCLAKSLSDKNGDHDGQFGMWMHDSQSHYALNTENIVW